MGEYLNDAAAIERRSMEIIDELLGALPYQGTALAVAKRIIHASGDPAYAEAIRMSTGFVAAAEAALRQGADIWTDVKMVSAGINRTALASLGGQVRCLIEDPQAASLASRAGITRSAAAVRVNSQRLHGQIVAIGNAPTALFQLLEVMDEKGVKPAAVIGVPVGFVGAAEAKNRLWERNAAVASLTVLGTKGGSAIAVAVVNALLYAVNPRK